VVAKYPRVSCTLLSGDEPIQMAGRASGLTLLDFWRWQGSRLLDNALRGLLAEFFVARSLGCADQPRLEWDSCDCRTETGARVEVKSAAYFQSWDQEKPAAITFGIKSRRAWEAATNTLSEAASRNADVYVFCLLSHRDKSTINPLDLDQWDFYVVATKRLDTEIPNQQTITLTSLLNRFAPQRLAYKDLKQAILAAADE
jgi:hypothetical protein